MPQPIITVRDNVNRHKKELAEVPFVMHNSEMGSDTGNPYFEQGRRLRWLRQAEGIRTGTAFSQKIGWVQSGYSQFETGKRRIPTDKVIQLVQSIPGFDPIWLWEGDKRGLSFDLRQRIEAEEAKEPKEEQSAS